MNIRPIGFVKSPVISGTDRSWGNIISEIHIAEELAPGLQGLDDFHYIIVIFYMHNTPLFDKEINLIRHPQGRKELPKLGIFAQRAKHRPNPIGVTSVELLSINGNILTVKGLDAIDSTPVLDIKPYTVVFDQKDVEKDPDWLRTIMQAYF